MKTIRLLALSCIFLSGCSVFSPVTPVKNTTYLVNTLPATEQHAHHSGTLFVAEPNVTSIYNTTDMAYSNFVYQIGYYVKSSWAATPGQMLQPLMVQTLQNTKHYATVTSTVGVGTYDYMLTTQLLQFLQDFTGGRNVFKLHVRLQLLSAATNHLVASKDIVIDIPASQNNAYAGVVAANQAVRDMLAEMATFCTRHS